MIVSNLKATVLHLGTKRRGSVLLLCWLLCFCFLGCPQTMIHRVEKLLPPPGYKPRYMTSSVPYDTLAKRYAEALRAGKVDTSALYDDDNSGAVALSRTTVESDSSANASQYSQQSLDSVLQSLRAINDATAISPSPQAADSAVAGTTPPTSAAAQHSTLSDSAREAAIRMRATQQRAMFQEYSSLLKRLPASLRDTVFRHFMRYGPPRTPAARDSLLQKIITTAAALPPAARDSVAQIATSALARTDKENVSRDSGVKARSGPPVSLEIRSVDDGGFPDLVRVRATAVDSTGRVILGLAPPYYHGPQTFRRLWTGLSDSCGGVRSAIDSFDVREVRETSNDPYALAFVIDHSGSMGSMRIRKLREAVRQTMNIIARGDMVSVLPFAGSVGVDVPLNADSAVYTSTFDIEKHAKLIGGTSIHEAVIVASGELSKAPATHKKAILLFTDGEDNTSKRSLQEAIRIAKDSGVAVYSIAYGLTNERPLENLSRLTGGRFYRIYSTKEFPFAFADIYRSLKNYYIISYKPPPCKGVHTISVRLSLPEYGVRSVRAVGHYDRSIVTDLDTVGAITFVNVEFETGKAVIQAPSLVVLEQIAVTMHAQPSVVMEIRGHTDDRGSESLNLTLSQMRAASVADALARMGVARERLHTKGFGASQPLVPNTTEENRAKNRRTEFVILKK